MTLKALLCNKYEFEINVSLKDESNKKKETNNLICILSHQDKI